MVKKLLSIPSKFVYQSLKRDLKHLKKEIKLLEEKLLKMVKKEDQKSLTLLKSISGIGVKTTTFLLVATEGFSKFEMASQLCNFVGITPTIRESGSSFEDGVESVK